MAEDLRLFPCECYDAALTVERWEPDDVKGLIFHHAILRNSHCNGDYLTWEQMFQLPFITRSCVIAIATRLTDIVAKAEGLLSSRDLA